MRSSQAFSSQSSVCSFSCSTLEIIAAQYESSGTDAPSFVSSSRIAFAWPALPEPAYTTASMARRLDQFLDCGSAFSTLARAPRSTPLRRYAGVKLMRADPHDAANYKIFNNGEVVHPVV